MLKKIDCVMVRVGDLEAAVKYYSEVFGLRPLWNDDESVGMGFPETDAEIVLHRIPDVPTKVVVHYLVEDVVHAVHLFAQKGCTVVEEPFDIAIDKCAVIRDPIGTDLCILDMSTGPRR